MRTSKKRNVPTVSSNRRCWCSGTATDLFSYTREMRKGRVIVVRVLAAIIVGAVVISTSHHHDPVYENKRLSEWIAELDSAGRKRAHAVRVLREIGTNAVPYLMQTLGHSAKSGWRNRAIGGRYIRPSSPANRILNAKRSITSRGTWAHHRPIWRSWKLQTLIGNTTSSASRARRPAPLRSCGSTTNWRKSFGVCRRAVRYFRICARFVPATGQRNFTCVAWAWASKGSPCIRIDTRGPNAPKKQAIPNGSRRRRWDITARPSIAPMRRAEVELPPLSEFERMRTKFAEMSKTIEPVMAKA
jgi:hypothetical protein